MANKRAQSRFFEDKDAERFALCLTYNAPLQLFKKKGLIAKLLLATINGSFRWEDHPITASFNLFGGELRCQGRRYFFPALAPFEVVNWHQWNSEEPLELTRTYANRSEKVAQEAPCWQIASFDESRGERISVMTTHAPRDDVFTIQYRLNQLLNESRRLIEPFAPEIRANYQAEKMRGFSDEEKAMITEMRADWRENAPMWDWK